jgi:hypothetical protein
MYHPPAFLSPSFKILKKFPEGRDPARARGRNFGRRAGLAVGSRTRLDASSRDGHRGNPTIRRRLMMVTRPDCLGMNGRPGSKLRASRGRRRIRTRSDKPSVGPGLESRGRRRRLCQSPIGSLGSDTHTPTTSSIAPCRPSCRKCGGGHAGAMPGPSSAYRQYRTAPAPAADFGGNAAAASSVTRAGYHKTIIAGRYD